MKATPRVLFIEATDEEFQKLYEATETIDNIMKVIDTDCEAKEDLRKAIDILKDIMVENPVRLNGRR